MKKLRIDKGVPKKNKEGGLSNPLHRKGRNDRLNRRIFQIFLILFIGSVVLTGNVFFERYKDNRSLLAQQKDLVQKKTKAAKVISLHTAAVAAVPDSVDFNNKLSKGLFMLPEYEPLYKENSNLIGWLKIADTNIDYPVIQTPEDEDYYLSYDFYGQKNSNGSLILDTDSNPGVGIRANNYAGGSYPSTNLIIHGHTMMSGEMFGNLKLFNNEAYGRTHNIIYFDSLYEKRKYMLIAIFYSQVYDKDQDAFKYYQFFQAETQEEFEDWYENIKKKSLYDTGETAEFGDEFITLSSCSDQVEDGRFVVVAKRIQ